MFGGRSQLGIKKMGELDPKPFQDLCLQKYSSEQWQEISAMLCSSWEENLKNPFWCPFKKIEVNGILQVHDYEFSPFIRWLSSLLTK